MRLEAIEVLNGLNADTLLPAYAELMQSVRSEDVTLRRAAVAARPEFRFRASHRPAAGGEREVAPLLMGRVGAVGRACREARRPAD